MHTSLNFFSIYSLYKKKDNNEGSQEKENDGSCEGFLSPPIIPRLKCLFAKSKDTKNIKWHAYERRCDKLLRHPVDFML